MQFHRVVCFTHRMAQTRETKMEEIKKGSKLKKYYGRHYTLISHLSQFFRFCFDISCGKENGLFVCVKRKYFRTSYNMYCIPFSIEIIFFIYIGCEWLNYLHCRILRNGNMRPRGSTDMVIDMHVFE